MADGDPTTPPLNITPVDRDIAIRTMIGEDGSSPDGEAGVAHVLLNRAAGGQWGSSLTNVALAPSQFESWNRQNLWNIDPNSQQYQRAAQIFDGSASGQIPDITNGSTHFYAPVAQAALGRAPPAWAKGPGLQIGGQSYYAPQGRISYAPPATPANTAQNAPAALSAALTPQGGAMPSVPSGTLAFAPDGLTKVMGQQPQGSPDLVAAYTKPQAIPATVAPATTGDSLLQMYTKPGAAVPAGSGASTTVPAALPANASPDDLIAAYTKQGEAPPLTVRVGDRAVTQNELDNIGKDPTPAPTMAQKVLGPLKDAASYAAGQVEAIPGDTAQNFRSGVALAKAGAANLGKGNILPSFPSADPRTWSAGGALQTAAGVGGAIYSPVSAAVSNLVEQPTTELTGNPEIGSRLGLVTNMLAGPQIASAAGKVAIPLTADARAAATAKNLLGTPSPELAARLAANPRLSLMDVDPNLQQGAMGIANQPGPGRAILDSAVKNRLATAPDAVASAYDAALGQTPDVPALLDNLKATARANAQQGFGAALSNAKPVDITPVLKAIDNQINPGATGVVSTPSNIALSPVKQALMDVRQQLSDGQSNLTDANDLHQIQSQLRVQAETLGNSASGQDRLVGGAIGNIRGKLVNQIDQAAGGAYKPAQRQFADDMGIQDAFHRGLTLLQAKAGEAGLADRPDAFAREWGGMSPDAQSALQQGLRVAVDQKINSVRFAARRGTDIPDVGFNQDKLATVLGPDVAQRLTQQMNDERDIAATNSKLFANSQTAPRQAGQAATQVRPVNAFSIGPLGLGALGEAAGTLAGYPGWTAAAMGAAALARKGYQIAGRASDIRRNASIANLLSGPGAPALDSLYPSAVGGGGSVSNLLAGATTGALGSGNKFVNLPAPSNR